MPEMAGPINVLLVEDRDDDAQLLMRELRKGGFEPFFERVETEAALRQALARRRWDVVISDYSMPAFDAPGALKALQESGFEVPFIIVSGSIGEDRAVSVLKDGASDFISKENLSRLVSALERELRDAASRRARREAEAALRASNERITALVSASPIAMVVIERSGNLVLWNPAARRIFGLAEEQALGRPPGMVASERVGEFAMMCDGVWGGKSFTAVEISAVNQSGTQLLTSMSLVPLRNANGVVDSLLALFEDITERRSLERQLFQAQKMDAIAKLAGGLAHDFNNLLTIINGRSHRILGKLAAEDPLWREADIIHQTGERAAKLIRQLLAFSRRQISDPQLISFNPIITDMAKMLKSLLGEGIEMVLLLDPDLRQVRANPAQLEQVVLNLVANANDAMEHGGRLTIQTANLRLSAEQVRAHAGAVPGSYATLIVSDTGKGMDNATQSRIFEPFFTTKAQGSGLGLATVYGIVKQGGGFIAVTSEIGKGASFRFCLPISELGDAHAAPAARTTPVTGSETILVVEDEDDVLALVVQVLETHGYQVKSARNWMEAFALVKRLEGGRIHLLLTDVVMPQMSGREIAASLAPLCPGMKVLYMSGYTDVAIVQHGVLEPGIRLLQKPFSPDLLVRMVRDSLDGA
jgi:hypothetical protein